MIQISKANVRSFDLDHLDIFWEIEPIPAPSNENAPHEIFDYSFLIFRSEAALGPYEQIGGPLRDTYRFRDVQVHLLHKWRQYHYKIRVLHIPTGETKDFGPFSSSEPEPDLIAAEIIRQEDVLFREFVGRRCWLFQIRTFGPACSCFDVSMKRKTRSNHLPCFGPKTLVRTENGYKPIETVKVGNRVLSSDGKFHSITKVFKTKYSGEAFFLKASSMTSPIVVTPEHPFITLKKNHNSSKLCSSKCEVDFPSNQRKDRNLDIRQTKYGRWVARIQIGGKRGNGRRTLGCFDTREDAIQAIKQFKAVNRTLPHELVWTPTRDLFRGGWLVSLWPSKEEDIQFVEAPSCFLGSRRLGPSKFKLTEELLWIIGFYLAEGSGKLKNGGVLQFSLHAKEVEFQNRVVNFFSEAGLTTRVLIDNNKCRIHVYSTILAQWWSWWLGRGCQNKHIPEELMYLPAHKLRAIIQGIWDGDGSKQSNEITQTSEILALQLIELLHRLGEQPLSRLYASSKKTPKGNTRKVAFSVNWAEDNARHKNRKGRWNFCGRLLSYIKKLEKINYDGFVYNLEVENDPTYSVQGILTHNCFGTGWLGGYHAPAEVFVQIDAQPKISQLSTLQESQTSDSTARMIAFPPAAPRDILIESENKRWRIVRVANTQRLRSVVHQELQLHEIPRGDIEYDIPVNVNTQSLIPSSERNFTNPYNIEKDGENYSDIYSVFGHPRGSSG